MEEISDLCYQPVSLFWTPFPNTYWIGVNTDGNTMYASYNSEHFMKDGESSKQYNGRMQRPSVADNVLFILGAGYTGIPS